MPRRQRTKNDTVLLQGEACLERMCGLPPNYLYFIFRGNNSGATNRLDVTVVKASNQIRLAQYDNGTNSNLATAYPLTINYDTDYDIQVVADGKHVEVWWGPAGGDLAKIIENDSAVVMSGPRMTFLTTSNTVVRVDDIAIAMPDSDTSTYTYNNGNELLTMVKGGVTTTFTYDDWGRQVSKIIGANSSVYTYRFGSMLKDVASTIPGEADLVQYVYDAFKKRREVVVTEASVITSDLWYRYDRGFNAIARYDDGAGTWGVGTRNQSVTYTGMTPLAEVPGSNPSSGSYRYYVHDRLGSTRALYDGSKVLLGRVAYTPYGEQAASTAGVEATYTYTGKPWEEETGLYFFPYRFYSPEGGRWVMRDPAGVSDGLNMYGYVGGAPQSRKDPLGLWAIPYSPNPFPGYKDPYKESCYERAWRLAEDSTNHSRGGSIRHCVAVCEAKRCYGSIGGWAATWANWWLDRDDFSEDAWRDFDAGNDGALIPSPKCNEDNDKYCLDKCIQRGY